MLHYVCDRCKKKIDPATEARVCLHVHFEATEHPPQGEMVKTLEANSVLHLSVGGSSGDSEQQNWVPLPIESKDHAYDLCESCYEQYVMRPLDPALARVDRFSLN